MFLLPGSKPRWGPSRRGLHVGGEGLGGRTHIRPDWDWQDSGELDCDGVGDGDCRWQYSMKRKEPNNVTVKLYISTILLN